MESLICVICSKNTGKNVISFTERTLKRCREVLVIRKAIKLKYHNVVLPSDASTNGYHPCCYKMFTAVSRKYYNPGGTCASTSVPQELSTDDDVKVEMDDKDSDGCERLCFFCDQKLRQLRGNTQSLHCTQKNSFIEFIKNYATNQDQVMLNRLDNSTSDTIFYHKICKQEYYTKFISSRELTETQRQQNRYFHRLAYEELCAFIEQNIISRGSSYYFSYLHRYYIELLNKNAENNTVTYDTTSRQQLEMKIFKTFGNYINLIYINKKKIITAKNIFCVDEKSLDESEILQKAAIVLRNAVLRTEGNLAAEKGVIPRVFTDFFTSLIGSDHTKFNYRVKSLSQDVIYAVSKGKIKTSKHFRLGSTLKRLSDQNVMDSINKYGHCCSFEEIEQLEDSYYSKNQANLSSNDINIPDIFIDFPFETKPSSTDAINSRSGQYGFSENYIKCENETSLHEEISIKSDLDEAREEMNIPQNVHHFDVTIKEECQSEEENDIKVGNIEQVFVPQNFDDSYENEMDSSANSSSVFIKKEPEDDVNNFNETSNQINVEDVENQTKINEDIVEDNVLDHDKNPDIKVEPMSDSETPQDGSTSQPDVNINEETNHINENLSENNDPTILKPYGCPICEKKFIENGDLVNHMRMHSDDRPYECCVCKKRFNKKSHLNIHMRKHSGERPYECEQCKKKFFQKCDLTYHMLTHTGEKPYECEICQMRFSRKNNKTKHLLLHSGQKPHECELCKKTFFEKSNLRKHMFIHSGENPFECEICQMKFNRSGNLATHMLTHSTEKTYICQICKKGFKREIGYKKHMEKHLEAVQTQYVQ